jgi:CRISPR-associated protein Cas5t
MAAVTMTMEMEALRVVVEGAVTSFRYPHFVQGVQPTYPMPPPATIYGHVCSALGELVPPDSFRAAVHFTAAGRFADYEHTHLIRLGEAELKPLVRELLFQPRLTLYLDRPDWEAAFRTPRYVITLGRSQDLMRCAEVRRVTLRRAASAYLEHTLLPLTEAADITRFTAQTMPRWITPERVPRWGQYALLSEPQHFSQPSWVDDSAPTWRGLPRAVFWLSFA